MGLHRRDFLASAGASAAATALGVKAQHVSKMGRTITSMPGDALEIDLPVSDDLCSFAVHLSFVDVRSGGDPLHLLTLADIIQAERAGQLRRVRG